MARCGTIVVVVTALLAVGLAVLFYQPLPDTLAEPWTIRIIGFKFVFTFIKGELGGLLGYNKLDILRSGINSITKSMESGQDFSNSVVKSDLDFDGVRVRMYRPTSAVGDLPVLVWYHGGGWILGDVDSTGDTSSYIAREKQMAVISVEYRLAPEHPFPDGFDDCVAATKYVLKNGKSLKMDPHRVAVGVAGESAGGQLAAAVALHLRDEKVQPALRAQVLVYAPLQMCDFSLPVWQMKQDFEGSKKGLASLAFFLGMWHGLSETQTKMITNGTFLTPEVQSLCRQMVDYKLMPPKMIPDGYQPKDQTADSVNDDSNVISKRFSDIRVSPLLANSLKNLPATFVVSAHWDYVRDDSPIYVKRLENDGGNVKWLHLADSFHGCFSAFGQTATGMRAMNAVLEFLGDTL